jgi:hypothetical protein
VLHWLATPHPGRGDLFVSGDATERVEDLLHTVADMIAEHLRWIEAVCPPRHPPRD